MCDTKIIMMPKSCDVSFIFMDLEEASISTGYSKKQIRNFCDGLRKDDGYVWLYMY